MPEGQLRVPTSFELRQSAAGRILVSMPLSELADHLFSTRDVAPAGAPVPDYAAIGAVLGLPDQRVIRVRQVHGREVLVVRDEDHGDEPRDADVIVSTDADRAVSVRIADCVPILMADRHGRAVAAVHAGWRGTAAGAAQAAVDALGREGVAPDHLVAAIGPSIGSCCYQVDDQVRDAFRAHGSAADDWFVPDDADRWRLDLWKANRAQLQAAGVPSAQIVSADVCTTHDSATWYSHRRQGADAGRMVAAIRLRPRA